MRAISPARNAYPDSSMPSTRLAGFFSALVLTACGQEPVAISQLPPTVNYVTLSAQPVNITRELPGRTSAFVVAQVRPQVTGIVKERLFEEGAVVTQGQALYQLDDATHRAALNSANASLARAAALLDVARLNANRADELIKTNAISKQEYDNTQAALRQAEAEVAVAQARVESSAIDLGYARITSPIDGRVGKSTVTRGALVTAVQEEALTTVQQLDPMYVDMNQSSSELLELRRMLAGNSARRADSLPVMIVLEDGTKYDHDGDLAFSDVTVDPSTGSYALRAIVPNPDGLLMPGMYVRALVTNAVIDDGLLLPPQGAVRDPQGNLSVMVLADDNTVEQRAITAQRTVGNLWLVNSGLVVGDRVIVEGLQKVRPGIEAIGTEIAYERDPASPPEGDASSQSSAEHPTAGS